jgi:hypothetical protein
MFLVNGEMAMTFAIDNQMSKSVQAAVSACEELQSIEQFFGQLQALADAGASRSVCKAYVASERAKLFELCEFDAKLYEKTVAKAAAIGPKATFLGTAIGKDAINQYCSENDYDKPRQNYLYKDTVLADAEWLQGPITYSLSYVAAFYSALCTDSHLQEQVEAFIENAKLHPKR